MYWRYTHAALSRTISAFTSVAPTWTRPTALPQRSVSVTSTRTSFENTSSESRCRARLP